MQGIRRKHERPPDEKEAVLGDDIIRMIETLGRDLRGLRDRAILLLGFAGGFRRSEIVGLDCGPDQTKDGSGWIEILRHGRVVTKENGGTVEVGEQGMIVHVRGKTGWREVEIGPGSSDHTCPVVALQTWLNLARIAHGPLFRRVTKNGKQPGVDRLNDKHIVRLVKRTALAAGVRGDLSEADRRRKFAGHSLRSADSVERMNRSILGSHGKAAGRRAANFANRHRDKVAPPWVYREEHCEQMDGALLIATGMHH